MKYWNFSEAYVVFFGMAATGKKASIDEVTLVRMEGGKITEERVFFDNLDLMTQLGQMSAAAGK